MSLTGHQKEKQVCLLYIKQTSWRIQNQISTRADDQVLNELCLLKPSLIWPIPFSICYRFLPWSTVFITHLNNRSATDIGRCFSPRKATATCRDLLVQWRLVRKIMLGNLRKEVLRNVAPLDIVLKGDQVRTCSRLTKPDRSMVYLVG